ncbi:MAG: YfhO family protein, partial [Lachnospiraceae bacterium]
MLYQKTIFTSERKVLRSTPEYSDAFIKRWTYVLSFLVPVLAMLIIFAAKEIYPFGDRSFLRTDLYHQYAPFTKAMKRLLSEGGSFFHTWESGLGTNFLSEYGYYLASPTNWFLILIPIDYVIEFISYLVIIKIGLCGLSMAYYLTNHHKKPDFAITLFAIFYAMSGYVAAYSWNIMWMDSIILFPIVIWAAERLVKEDKCIMYTLTLGLAILTNYYIGIMFCLFLPFYFLIQLILLQPNTIREYTSSKRIVRQQYRPNYLKKIINFAIHSLLAGGLAAVILIPVFKALFTTASSERFWIDSDFEPYFSMFDILSRQLMLTDTHQKLEHWPNIYCGVAIFLLIPMYAMNRKVRTKEKALYFGLVLFFLISFNQEILEFIWHGLHKPNSLPGRQSFIYIFILLHMSYQGWQWLKSASRAQLAGTFAFAVGFILLAEHLITQEELHWYTYYVSLLFIIIYGILCYLYQHKNLWRSSIAIIALCVVMIESCINMAVTSITSVSRSNYSQYDENFSAVLQQAEAAEDNNFYRVERVDRRTKNDGAWYDYNSASIFSSAANSSLTDLYKQFGMEGSTNSYCMTGSTWLTYMLFDIQYILSASEITTVNEDMLTLFAQEGNGYLYKNNHALSLGFITRSDLDLLCSSASSNPVDNQNEFSRY